MTTPSFFDAASALADILQRENGALDAVDYTAAVRLAEAKQRALAAFASATANLSHSPSRAPAARDLARHLEDLATKNRAWLERAIVVQRHVIASVVRAIPRPPTRHYGASGGLAQPTTRAPVALVARA